MNNKKLKKSCTQKTVAFTLAEVLITLGIIGIVAAMTLPAVINDTKNKELEVGFKKGYSIISQAVMRMQSEEGMIANTNNYGMGKFVPVFIKYFNGGKDCGLHGCESYEWESSDIDNQLSQNYQIFSKKRYAGSGYFDEGQYIMSDSMFLMIENNSAAGNSILISIDVNGFYKKPNVWGYDLFTFQIDQESGKVLPMGAPGTRWTNHATYCSTTSDNRVNGASCAYKAFTEKDYFKNLP